MGKDMGITNVLIGHSERRGEFGIMPFDTNETLAAKLKYILDAGLTCVYCIGEPKEIREKGIAAVLAEMEVQLKPIYSLLDPAKVVIAYEPVWAIGTGLSATPADAQETHKGIRDLIATGVSPEVDGFLVGGASLKPEIADVIAAIAAAKC